MIDSRQAPLIVHVVYRFAIGGLENGLINLVNRLPRDLARHRIIALCGVDPTFMQRIDRSNCEVEDLAGDPRQQTARQLPKIFRRFRSLRPALVHTRNIATLECQYAAWAARVSKRVHGEHGWDDADQYGSNARYTRLRRISRHVVHREIALSSRTADYLRDIVGVPAPMIRAIYNGVDTSRFAPADQSTDVSEPADWPFGPGHFVIGTVGRLSSVKNQSLLCRAFGALRGHDPAFRERARLVVVGSGPDRAALEQILEQSGSLEAAWFTGDRSDIPALLRRLDVFALTSRAEGLSNSILEAMATALPVIATDVGGNPEQVAPGKTGTLITSEGADDLASALAAYFKDPELRRSHGLAARSATLARFSLTGMIDAYASLYAELLAPSASKAFHSTSQPGAQ